MLYGLGIGLMLQSNLGVPPWDVLHQGLARHFGLTVGIWSIIISMVVLIGWLPLREPYGVGTLLNAVIIGIVIDLSILAIPEPEVMVWRIGAARHLLQAYGDLNLPGQVRILELIRIADALVRCQLEISPAEGVTVARREIRACRCLPLWRPRGEPCL